MKILLVLGFPNPFTGAAWTRVGFFAKQWSKAGNNVDVIGAFTPNTFNKKGSTISENSSLFNIIFTIDSHSPLLFLFNSISAFLSSLVFLSFRRPAVAVVSLPTGSIGLGCLIALNLFRIPYIIDYRDEWEDYSKSISKSKFNSMFYTLIKKVMTLVYAHAQLVIAVTSNTLSVLKKRGITKLKLFPNGADARIFKPIETKENEPYFKLIYCGAICEYYRIDVIFESLKKLLEKGIRNIKLILVIPGDAERILNIAKQLNILEYVDYRKAISDKTELSKIIANADIGLIPYDDNALWKNSLPAKFFEYCSCGIPVVATAFEDSLIAQLIKDHKLGLVSPPLDENKLADNILELYSNPNLQTFRKRVREFIETNFDRNKIAFEYLNLLCDNIIDDNRKC